MQREQTERGPGEDLGMQPIRVLAREIPGTCYFGRLSSAAGNRNALELEDESDTSWLARARILAFG